jgi:formylglycine-generating enzyme required for sulfatase activity/cephalosporin-C deacetylase-like acetyl esterase/predicted Ser/Thr protein kinase
MIGRTVAHYRITAPLGEGGMGVVYEAEDLRLPRRVALKFLPPSHLEDHAARERFEREARAASVLSHPHICVLHDVAEHEGQPFIVMERLQGTSLREKLQAGPLTVAEILKVGVEVADALDAAHAAGIVHRDVKPANIVLTDRGDAKVLDFGVARLRPTGGAEAASEVPTLEKLTTPGTAVGTVAYMSPEQVLGRPADARSDIFSLGVVLYEMGTGTRPFPGDSMGAVFDAILHKAPTSPVRLNPRMPVKLERIVNRCLEKDPAKRWASAAELRDALKSCLDDVQHTGSVRVVARRLARSRWAWAAVVLVVAALAAGAVAYARHRARVRWAREQALPEVERLIDGGSANYLAAYRLAVEAEGHLPADPALQKLLDKVSVRPTVTSEPSGATVWVKPYRRRESPWERLGETPIRGLRLPVTWMRWRVEKAGFVPILRAGSPGVYDPETGVWAPMTLSPRLVPEGTQPTEMVRVEGTDDVPEFLIDRCEVTNRQFKAFVDAGGYRDRKYWKHEFKRDGRVLSWTKALRNFVDRTGRPGPATWEAGDFPEGKADFPVGGVSWYEAAAFAEFAGKSLPTLEHWWAAAGRPRGSGDLVALSNFRGEGPVAAGSTDAITPFGAVDMAGNVREWCWNASAQGHCLRGGAWNDQVYMFGNITQAPTFDRSETNGFRCVRYLEGKAPPDKLFAPYRSDAVRDLMKEKPVSDEVFTVYRRLFDYDPRDLQARVETRDETRPDWIRERVSFTAAYRDERVIGQLYLPRAARPPYQVVVYFPGSDAIRAGPSDELEQRLSFWLALSPFLKAGRAVFYPVYKGTHERNDGTPDHYARLHMSGDPTQEYADYQVMIVRDVRRALDYLASRPDVDSRRVAFEGLSWGGFVASIVLAVEPRFAAAIVVLGGLDDIDRPRPEVDLLNYAPRVKLPVLMLNGRYDLVFPLESSARPMFQLLGTPRGDKVLRVYDSDHMVPRSELIRESLAWLDKYLGPVPTAATLAAEAKLGPSAR